jgi:hypothetical protein
VPALGVFLLFRVDQQASPGDVKYGIRLAAPYGLLQEDRVSKLFARIGSITDAERPEVTALILEVATLDPPQWG